jgi:hypothetical protein
MEYHKSRHGESVVPPALETGRVCLPEKGWPSRGDFRGFTDARIEAMIIAPGLDSSYVQGLP